MTTTKMTSTKKTTTTSKKTTEKEFKCSMMGFLTEEGSFSDENGFAVNASYYQDGFTYRTWRCGNMTTGIIHYIEKTTGTYDTGKSDYIFDDNVYVVGCQSNNIDKKSFEIIAYHNECFKQTACKLCYSFDNTIKPSSSFNRKRHGETKKHQNNKKKCMDAVMDITKKNYDVANVIMSYL